MKRCRVCKVEKDLDSFDRSSREKSGRRSECKRCRAEYAKKTKEHRSIGERRRRKANPDLFTQRHRVWAENNKEHLLEYQKSYRNDPANRQRKQELRKKNSAAYTARERLRYSRKRRAVPAWADPKAIEAYYRAARYVSLVAGQLFEVDHIVPLTSKLVCGLHCEANLQVITEIENVRKGNRWWPDMWQSIDGPVTNPYTATP